LPRGARGLAHEVPRTGIPEDPAHTPPAGVDWLPHRRESPCSATGVVLVCGLPNADFKLEAVPRIGKRKAIKVRDRLLAAIRPLSVEANAQLAVRLGCSETSARKAIGTLESAGEIFVSFRGRVRRLTTSSVELIEPRLRQSGFIAD
jgi:biotin operon repressor